MLSWLIGHNVHFGWGVSKSKYIIINCLGLFSYNEDCLQCWCSHKSASTMVCHAITGLLFHWDFLICVAGMESWCGWHSAASVIAEWMRGQTTLIISNSNSRSGRKQSAFCAFSFKFKQGAKGLQEPSYSSLNPLFQPWDLHLPC